MGGAGVCGRLGVSGGPGLEGLVIVGCSRRKLETAEAVQALDLYQGWCVPLLRARIGASVVHRRRTLILSARYGLVAADEVVAPYDEVMTPEKAHQLQGPCGEVIDRALAAHRAREALVLLEPRYLEALPGLAQSFVRVCTFTDPVADWSQVDAVLDRWGWP